MSSSRCSIHGSWKRDYAATVTAFLSVSYDPPTMLVSLYAGSGIGGAIATTGTWALSLLRSKHRGAADWLASPGTPVEGLLAQVPYRRGPATGSVILDGSMARAVTKMPRAGAHPGTLLYEPKWDGYLHWTVSSGGPACARPV
jgi:flavin reductase (DIM6/NTAB) family NADH-FMN oxidoreductase RutF